MIKTTERLTKEYSEKFFESILTGKAPFDFKIGDTSVSELFGEACSSGTAQVRYAKVGEVDITATYRRLGGAVEVGVEIENNGDKNSPQIYDIDILNIVLPDSEPYRRYVWNMRRVLYSVGSPSTIYDFAPREEDITSPEFLALEERGGQMLRKLYAVFQLLKSG